MILLLLVLSVGSVFASDTDDVEVYSSASLESTQLAAAPGITPYTADYELSVVRGETANSAPILSAAEITLAGLRSAAPSRMIPLHIPVSK